MPDRRANKNAKLFTKRPKEVSRREAGTDWDRLGKLSDREIRRAVRSDPDAAPIASAAWFRRAKIVLPEPKKAVSIRLDKDITEWFQRQGSGYQTRINAVLRAYVDAHR